jgi:antitoxin component YwqK of YwqJK toxin-antitoxin module
MTRRNKAIVIIACSVALLATLIWYCWGYIPGTLYFDKNGEPHGTGIKKYFYTSGALKLEDHYLNGKLSKSIWFKPDGAIVATTKWDNGSGIGYYLRDDGSVRVQMEYIGGAAQGKAIYYREDGSVDKYVEFHNGAEVGH